MPSATRTPLDIVVHPVTPDRLPDLADLFGSSATTRGCWCVWFMATAKERQAGWGKGNRARFERFARSADPPAGLLAYADDVPIAWCATGPRARYPSAIGPRVTIMAGRDPSEDDDVWLVPCFFVRVGYRRSGATHMLLEAAVALAAEHGARAIEGFPIAGDVRSADGYLGRESLFQSHGFRRVAQPTPRRAVMRRDLRARRRG